jgi:hypothetical protein
MAAGDIVPVPGAQFEETLASAGQDLLRAMIREFAQRMMDGGGGDQGDLPAGHAAHYDDPGHGGGCRSRHRGQVLPLEQCLPDQGRRHAPVTGRAGAWANAAGAVTAKARQAPTSPASAAAMRRMRRSGFMTVSFGS